MAQTWFVTDGLINPQDVAEISTTAKLPLGTRRKMRHLTYGEGEFIYLLGAANTIAGSVVHFNSDDFSTTLAVANGKGPIAVAVGANVASSYGWYQIYGKCPTVAVAADVADNADCYLTATDGKIDDSDVAGDHINNMKFASANATGGASTVEAELAYPFTTDGADD